MSLLSNLQLGKLSIYSLERYMCNAEITTPRT